MSALISENVLPPQKASKNSLYMGYRDFLLAARDTATTVSGGFLNNFKCQGFLGASSVGAPMVVEMSGLRGERGLEDKSLNSVFLGEIFATDATVFDKSTGRSGFLGDSGLATRSLQTS